MQTIGLTQGMTALVDDADWSNPDINTRHWCFRKEARGNSGYAATQTPIEDGKQRILYLHRLIMQPDDGFDVKFRNGDRLDCRRANLVIVPSSRSRFYTRGAPRRIRHHSCQINT